MLSTNNYVYFSATIFGPIKKAILSYKILNTMDIALVMDVLDQALSCYGAPEMFNTYQGSQYTSEIHTQRLKINESSFRWMEKDEQRIIFALNGSGEVQNANGFI